MIGCLSPHFRRSKLYSGVQSHRPHSGVQSHRSHSGVQSHCSHSGVQSHITTIQDCHFLLDYHSESFLLFKATFISFRRSTPCIHVDIQSHYLVWQRSEPYYQHLGLPFSFRLAFKVILIVQSHFHQFQAFRATFLFDIQSHYIFVLAFRVITSFISAFKVTSSLRRSKPLLVFYLPFRAAFSVRHSESPVSFIRPITIFLRFGVQSHWAHSFGPFCVIYFLQFWRSEPFFIPIRAS